MSEDEKMATKAAHALVQFPPQFSVYHSPFSSTYTLGERKSQPIYAITTHFGWSGQLDVVLHSGPDENSPPLAGVDSDVYVREAIVKLSSGPGLEPSEEKVKVSGSGSGAHIFKLEMGSPARPEIFEWRPSAGPEVVSLAGWSAGWELVHHATDGLDGPQSHDGKPIVAVFSHSKSTSITKDLNFKFLGRGADGTFGERWAIMAVILALRIWDRGKKLRTNLFTF